MSAFEAGEPQTWKIQAQDLYRNIVLGTNELFQLSVLNLNSGVEQQASISYRFNFYEASFTLEQASDYSAVVQLKQQGGLMATYYKTTGFQAAFEDLPRHSHDPEEGFTQIDSQIDFEGSFALQSGQAYPTQFVSVEWQGYVKAPYSETFNFYVNAFASSYF